METATLESKLIDAAEFARLLSVSKPTIWRLRDNGKLPPAIALTSQCVRWRREAILKWIDAGCPSLATVNPPSGDINALS